MAKIQPLGANILVKPVEEEKTTESGIVLPEGEGNETPQEGEVVAVGDSSSINSKIKEGVKIIFKQYAGSKVEFEGQEYLILNAMEDVLAVVE